MRGTSVARPRVMSNFRKRRERMVENDIAARGIGDSEVLRAFREVAREDFVPEPLAEFAYEDVPLPLEGGQTISQPYIVAVTIAALELPPGARVLEIGTGSGYSAALLSRLAHDVYTMDRVEALAKSARERLGRLGFHNVHVMHGDGTLGWRAHAPYDGIAVAAGGPSVPKSLVEQLAIGGRLVMPIGPDASEQTLIRVIRTGASDFREEPLGEVRFVPLIGAHGWPAGTRTTSGCAALLREVGEKIDDVDEADVGALLERIGSRKVVLLGESTHGTSEFYRMRARITKELVLRRGFDFVAVEADWSDAARICDFLLGRSPRTERAPSRFPTWRWENEEVAELAHFLRAYNVEKRKNVGFHGLDHYSMFASIAAVLKYLDTVDPDAAKVARHRYGSLTPWQKDPAEYGRAVLHGRYQSSEGAVLATLRDMLARRFDDARREEDKFLDRTQSARVTASAERYYRAMYYATAESWNLRDSHMYETLRSLLAFYGPDAKGVVWAHNAHVGDARATEMAARGKHNIGQLCRTDLGDAAYLVGFGTDHGTVAAAAGWDEPMAVMPLRRPHRRSYERIMQDSGVPAMIVHLRDPVRSAVRDELMAERLERAIGVVYRPEHEFVSHSFQACLSRQFDEYVWISETRGLAALAPSLFAGSMAQHLG